MWKAVEKLKEKRESRQCEAEGLALCFALLFSSVILSDFLLKSWEPIQPESILAWNFSRLCCGQRHYGVTPLAFSRLSKDACSLMAQE